VTTALTNAEIGLDTAGTLVFDPTELGRPSVATVTLNTPGGVEHVASQSATIDSVNTTLSANATVDDMTVTLTAITSIEVGRRYIITNADGQLEWVRVAAVDTATKVVTLADPLAFAYEAADTFVGGRLTVAITAGQATPLAEGYEALWSYTIDSVAYTAISLFNVVRYPWPIAVLPTWEFKQHAGSLSASELELTSRDGLAFSDEIAMATEQVRSDLRERSYDPGRFKTAAPFKRAIALRVLLGWAEQGTNIPRTFQDSPEAWLDASRDRYTTALGQALNNGRNYDADGDGTVTETERTDRLGSRRIRI